MKLEINLSKGKFWALMAVGILLVGVLVYAAATKPNPGHSVEEIGGLDGEVSKQVKEIFKNIQIITEDLSDVDQTDSKVGYGTSEVFCSEKVPIGCAVFKTGGGEAEDVYSCKINEDKNGCVFSVDQDGSGDSFDGGTGYCYCI